MDEWGARCGFTGTSKNCENLRLAVLELQKEYKAKAEERTKQANESMRKAKEEFLAEMEAEEKATEQAERETEERAQAQQKQDNN